ncbi:uncharacterized protein LOC103382409 isoform X2 [Cynoglossus semilaevis]|uniref:uncharacterized protein LOC103382409 isoform X2 n=1 Tax=Cynoglossus semilaevis TaxID=244447 RepID=UPI0007DCB3F7|nr:uncharacterized protein LOC103382409 isoform X2 [Cynoglossus semilaevis]
MSRAHRDQEELEEVRGGATLLILLDSLQTGRCSEDRQETEREEELHLLYSSGQVTLAEQKLQLTSDLFVPDHTESIALNLRRNTDLRSDLTTLHQHCCFLENNCTVLQCPQEAPWTRLVLNPQDILAFIRGNGMNLTSQPRVLRMDHSNNVIISRGDLVAAGLFPDCRTIEENTDFHFRHHNSGSHDNPRPDPNNNPEVHHCETTSGENLNIHSHKGLLKAPENLCGPGESSGKDKKIRKKSVSFDDDVMVFLFDQESPTEDLTCGTHKPPPTPEIQAEENALEWEDDFSALEDSFQHVGLSQRHICTPPTHMWPAPTRPQRYLLSQNHLFLTHVNESDLEF